MSSFYAKSIIFDGIPSEVFGLIHVTFETGKYESAAGSESTVIQKYIPKRTMPFYFGRTQNIPLEIKLTLASESPLDGKARSAIESWLLGRKTYLPLSVVQSDLDNIVFYVIFPKGSNQYMGNLQRSIIVNGVCNAPWGFEMPPLLNKSYTGSAIVSENFTFFNGSDDSDYNYPNISFTTSSTGNSFSLINHTDNERTFLFSGISALESITIDCDKKTITSTTGLLRMGTFNKNFFRLVPGINNLTMAGGLTAFSMANTFAKKVGS